MANHILTKHMLRKEGCSMQTEEIDFVIPWVDGNDAEWKKQFNRYAPDNKQKDIDIAQSRYSDYGLLKYWFRGVETYAPWVRKIHFITNGQKPEWLNTENPKLHWVTHKDYIPEKWLPVFSSHPIELHMHAIEGLSDHFVYFNDDMYITNSLKPGFFFKDGKPVLHTAASIKWIRYDDVFSRINFNDCKLINTRFSFNNVVKQAPGKWLFGSPLKCCLENFFYSRQKTVPGFSTQHQPNPYTKTALREVWEAFPEALEETSSHRFRSDRDVNQFLFYYWQLCTNSFVPKKKNDRSYYVISEKNMPVIKKAILGNHCKMLCLNDNDNQDCTNLYPEVISYFQEKLPEKSSFEL